MISTCAWGVLLAELAHIIQLTRRADCGVRRIWPTRSTWSKYQMVRVNEGEWRVSTLPSRKGVRWAKLACSHASKGPCSRSHGLPSIRAAAIANAILHAIPPCGRIMLCALRGEKEATKAGRFRCGLTCAYLWRMDTPNTNVDRVVGCYCTQGHSRRIRHSVRVMHLQRTFCLYTARDVAHMALFIPHHPILFYFFSFRSLCLGNCSNLWSSFYSVPSLSKFFPVATALVCRCCSYHTLASRRYSNKPFHCE
jgi:hypothetical protein